MISRIHFDKSSGNKNKENSIKFMCFEKEIFNIFYYDKTDYIRSKNSLQLFLMCYNPITTDNSVGGI